MCSVERTFRPVGIQKSPFWNRFTNDSRHQGRGGGGGGSSIMSSLLYCDLDPASQMCWQTRRSSNFTCCQQQQCRCSPHQHTPARKSKVNHALACCLLSVWNIPWRTDKMPCRIDSWADCLDASQMRSKCSSDRSPRDPRNRGISMQLISRRSQHTKRMRSSHSKRGRTRLH